jgi:hypothetical protein
MTASMSGTIANKGESLDTDPCSPPMANIRSYMSRLQHFEIRSIADVP